MCIRDSARAALRATGKIGSSSFCQDITLAVGESRVEFRTEIDWHELHRLLDVYKRQARTVTRDFQEIWNCPLHTR